MSSLWLHSKGEHKRCIFYQKLAHTEKLFFNNENINMLHGSTGS